MSNKNNTNPPAAMYYGLDGIKKIYQDTYQEPDTTLFVLLGIRNESPEFLKWIWEEYFPKLRQNNIFSKCLAPRDEQELHEKEDKKFYKQTKYIDRRYFEFEMEINIYGNKVAFISYDPGKEFGMIVENEKVVKAMKSMFKFMWRIVRKRDIAMKKD